MRHSLNSLFIILLLFIGGCYPAPFAAPRPLFSFSDTNQSETQNYNYKVQKDSVNAALEGFFSINYQANLIIELRNNSKEQFLINIDRDNIWLNACEGTKNYLTKVYVSKIGSDPGKFILHRNSSSYLEITFEQPSCLPFDVKEEKFAFTIHLGGFELQRRSKEKFGLFDEVMIFARQ